MELTPAQITALQTLTLNSNKVNRETLSVGQQLLAKVIASNSSTGEVTLSINNALLNAKSSIPLSAGQSLQLIVAQLGKEVVLQLPQALIEKAITQQTLRQSLPQQQAQSDTLRNLQDLVQQGKNSGISEKVIQFAQKFLQQIPGSKQLSNPETLKEVIHRSGIFLEHKLANVKSSANQSVVKGDFKSFLLQLKSLLVSERTNTASQATQLKPDAAALAKQQAATNEARILDLAKQIKSDQGKAEASSSQVESKQHGLLTKEEVKAALQQALDKINQQQKNISQNLSRLLARATNTPLGTSSPALTTTALPNPSVNKENVGKPASIALKDALAFTTNAQKSQKPEINFSRLNNLVDLLDTLIKQVDAGISRTQLHQLNSLLEPEGNKLNWSMEVPVKVDDKLHSIHLHLEKEQAADEDSEPVLTVNIALDLEHLGPIYARITLISDNVGVALWAERQETYQLSEDHVDDLQENLRKSGLKPENISFHHGQPPHNPVLNKPLKSALLDIKV